MLAGKIACRVVFIGSWAAHAPHPHIGAYAVSKAAIRSLCQTIALDHAKDGMLINEVAPWIVDAGLSHEFFNRDGTCCTHDRIDEVARTATNMLLTPLLDMPTMREHERVPASLTVRQSTGPAPRRRLGNRTDVSDAECRRRREFPFLARSAPTMYVPSCVAILLPKIVVDRTALDAMRRVDVRRAL